MSYNDAIAAVESGKYGWRTSWSGEWLQQFNGQIYLNTPQGPAQQYNPTPADKAATDWAIGDRPPK
jgi:hypothetical protein